MDRQMGKQTDEQKDGQGNINSRLQSREQTELESHVPKLTLHQLPLKATWDPLTTGTKATGWFMLVTYLHSRHLQGFYNLEKGGIPLTCTLYGQSAQQLHCCNATGQSPTTGHPRWHQTRRRRHSISDFPDQIGMMTKTQDNCTTNIWISKEVSGSFNIVTHDSRWSLLAAPWPCHVVPLAASALEIWGRSWR
jgi:hypothetical protein